MQEYSNIARDAKIHKQTKLLQIVTSIYLHTRNIRTSFRSKVISLAFRKNLTRKQTQKLKNQKKIKHFTYCHITSNLLYPRIMQILGIGKTALGQIHTSKTVQLKQIHVSGNPVSRISLSGGPQVASFTYLSTILEALFLEHVQGGFPRQKFQGSRKHVQIECNISYYQRCCACYFLTPKYSCSLEKNN